ncbi:MAG TPA: DUF222 domain-containing protein [Actinocrinis sp.]|uniref:HNH endonuclease signature motif containing protein n=1 Tax=Actinocrinis sp. TaxID=1920516 RepID=UPI002D458B19|nr:DUF222 domain-containing protein [Actinocrinis sp.]HZU54695.1 DUF222 domain-containing protein [Actinocrinis sp.]
MHATPDLSRAALIDALIGTEKRLAQLHAAQHRLLATLAQSRGTDPLDCTEEEITAALRWSPNTTRNRLHTAHSLATRFPETLDLMAAGSVSNAQANALVEITAGLEPDAARAAQNRVLARLPHQSVAATRKARHRAVLAVDPQAAHKRHLLETKKRRVTLCPEPDGMATLALYTPAQTGAAVMAALDLHARQRSEGDARTLDQRRADSLAHLVLSSVGVPSSGTTQTTAEVPALIQITVGIDTLLGSSEEPAELRGIGPITAGQARAIAFGNDATWRRLLTAPDGTLLHADARTYRPTASVERLVRLRDRHCMFPGCAMPAARCDLDHIIPFDHHRPEHGGATTPQNLHSLCRRHHRLKTAGSWKVAREGEGEVVWSAPTGHGYSTRAEAYAA